ncbi:MAG: flavodoxin family protein [Coprobacillaceae bacterium]
MSNILILNGSPRKKGNTAILLDSFVNGAKRKGHNVSRFDLHFMNIHPCIGCLQGGNNNDNPCTQNDDMKEIYPVYKEADIVVFASPLYFWNFTSQLKGAIDRLYAVTEEYGKTPKKEAMLFVAAEGTTPSNYAPMVMYYESTLKHLRWKDKGQLFVGEVHHIGDIKGRKELDKAYQIGMNIK